MKFTELEARMHHAKDAHKFAKAPSHAFVLPRDGEMAELLQQAFPEAYFDEKHLEWRIDWDERQFPTQGQRLDDFSIRHKLEIFHRY